MDNDTENYIDPEKSRKWNNLKPLHIDNVFSNVENPQCSDKRRNILLTWMHRTFHWTMEKKA